jgi:hypothetical protein
MSRNILLNGSWTSSPPGSSLRKEAPKVRVVPYKLDATQLESTIEGFVSVPKELAGGSSFYNSLYKAQKSGKAFVFPFFNNEFRNFSSEFADTLSNITDRGTVSVSQMVNEFTGEATGVGAQVADFIANLKGVSGGPSTGTYIETPKFYQFANNDQALSFSFPLLNTVSEGDAATNTAFIKEFTELNRPRRESAVSMNFPHIYKVKVPGLRFIRWAYCENLSFSMLGQRRLINKKMVPEAYMCSMSFKSLTVEVANFLDKI